MRICSERPKSIPQCIVKIPRAVWEVLQLQHTNRQTNVNYRNIKYSAIIRLCLPSLQLNSRFKIGQINSSMLEKVTLHENCSIKIKS